MVTSLRIVSNRILSLAVRNLNHCMKMSEPTISSSSEAVTSKELRIPVPWGHIAAKAWGSEVGIPLLGLHGWQDNAGTFDRVAMMLPTNVYFVAVDLPGHGMSSHIPKHMAYHYIDWVLHVRRIVDFMKWDEFSFIGHSMGCGVGMIFASLFPNRVKKLIFIDGLGPIPTPPEQQPLRSQMSIETMIRLENSSSDAQPVYTFEEAVQKLVEARDGKILEDSAKILLRRGTCPIGKNTVQFTRDPRLRVKAGLSMTPDQVRAFVSNLKGNLLVFACKSGHMQNEFFKKLLTLCSCNCSKFKLVEVEANHHVHLDHPEMLAAEIRAFLSCKL